MAPIEVFNLSKTYRIGSVEVHALSNVSFTVERGEFLAIMGSSGSGKSTLMHILGCLDRPTAGSYHLDNRDVTALSNKELSIIRNHKIGFVFQSYNLISQLDVIENVEVPLVYDRLLRNHDDGRERCLRAIESVGLIERIRHRPSELSGGEMQRVAIARELYRDPEILIFDEATSALDTESEQYIQQSIEEIKGTKTMILIAHRLSTIKNADYIYVLDKGRVVEEGTFDALYKNEKSKFYTMCRMQSFT